MARRFGARHTGAETFGKDKRLNSRAEFDPVFDQTEVRVSRKGIVMLARRNKLSRSRLGMVISKRSLKLASDRNRLKRVVRELFRREPRLVEGSAIDIVVMSRPGVRLAGVQQVLANLMDDLLKRVSRLECA